MNLEGSGFLTRSFEIHYAKEAFQKIGSKIVPRRGERK